MERDWKNDISSNLQLCKLISESFARMAKPQQGAYYLYYWHNISN